MTRSIWPLTLLERTVGSKGKVIGGPFGSDLTTNDYTASGVPVIRVTNQVGRIVGGEFVFVSDDKAQRLSANIASKGDIVVVQRGSTYGKVSRIPANAKYERFVVCQSQMAISVDEEDACGDYVFQALLSPFFKRHVDASVIQTGQPHINLGILRDAKIPLPPLPEQRRIAEILQTWDEAIEKLEALRATKEQRRLAAARKFFDPCHPKHAGRPNDWREYELGDVFRERVDAGNADDRLLSITMNGGVIDRDDVGRKDTSTADKSKYKLILPGDLGYNTMRMWQGVVGLSVLRGIISPAYTVATPISERIVGEYAAHFFKSRRMVFDFERYSQGLTSDTWNLKFPAFSKISVFLPPIEFQKKQADLLDAMLAETAVIYEQITALQRQKRGLMQKLLTGEWRVTVNEPTEAVQ